MGRRGGGLKMALTIKHKDDGSFYEQGDTQGLMIPTFRVPDYDTGWVSFSGTMPTIAITHNLNEPLANLDVHFYGSKNGIYSDRLSNVNTGYQSIEPAIYSKDDNSFMISGSNTPVYIANGSAFVLCDSYRVMIYKRQFLSPYMIANKGALVSGGAFQFDLDGNGYTDNYSTDEVKCGIWIDGKPIYKKTWNVNNGTSFGAGVYLDLGVAAPTDLLNVIDYRMTIGTTNSSYKSNVRVTYNDLRLSILTNGNFGGYNVASIQFLITNTAILTVYYTKTTD
jgi:hypothetical protein